VVSHLFPFISSPPGCIFSLVSSGREPKKLFSQQLTHPFAGIIPLIVRQNRDKSLFSVWGKRIEAF